MDPPVPAAPDDGTLSDAEQESLREALVRLRDELSQARTALASTRATELQEANARLVVAALRSDEIAETALRHLSELALNSYRDVLTGIPNRVLMRDHLDAAIAIARRAASHFAVFFIDFDHFREINRTLGHTAGDEVLRLGARRLGSVIRETDTLSRHGGDEFLALITQLARPGDAAHAARQMLHALAQPAEVAGAAMVLSASIGIAIYPHDGEDADTLISHADAAMYRAKSAEPGSFRFFRADEAAAEAVAPAPVAARRVASSPARAGDAFESTLREANTQLLLTALQAQEREQQLREAQHQQIQFMAMVVHELRHPLTPLMLAAEMLGTREMHDSATLKSLQGIVDHQVTRLSRLIGDLLDGARIGVGKLRLKRQPMDLLQALHDATDASGPLFALRHQSLQVRLPLGPVAMMGDTVRLTQVFCNLLDNASKYSAEGAETTLTLTAREHEFDVTVTDSGIGIDADALESIFGLFVQDDRGLACSHGGLGIGLALVRELVQAHGGQVSVHSAGHDLGSTFVVSLPRMASAADAPFPGLPQAPAPAAP
ncbi:diguanylate cyclase domain-containing protein [Dyella sp.]|jgi:diguanylate cyclase (GGDEF)-like protein|uniref:diguanylate cyclase domain-containing protein n=1 Tax=Dyella sp. TaxID=1869338 RepID=UPI002D7A33E0|nr:diguanylate cyclase [Dyella sp.]HET6430671.1 diguanylate cyclase [Dyella sp.]